MTESSPSPGIRASLNEAGELVLTAMNTPPEAVIRMDECGLSPHALRKAAIWLRCRPRPARASASACSGKARHYAPETFIMPGTPPAQAVPSTLIPCTQDRLLDLRLGVPREAACRIVRETQPEPPLHRRLHHAFLGRCARGRTAPGHLQKSPETWNLCTAGMRAVNLGLATTGWKTPCGGSATVNWTVRKTMPFAWCS
ncbi:MAG: hypothetical protein ACLT38_03095 [Akkermansia sp.]